MINVQFSSDKKKIIAFFSGPQSADDYPDLGTVEATDKRYIAFIKDALPSTPSFEEPADKSE